MALHRRLPTQPSRYQRITLWVIGVLLLLQLLAVLSTWQCSGPTHRAAQGKPPLTSLILWLSGHGMCEEEAGSKIFPFEGVMGHSRTVRQQRPYAYAFCLTSIHHLCTALVNVVRLRKLHSSQNADIVALVPTSWAPIVEASMRASNMQDMRNWAISNARVPLQDYNPDLVKQLSAQQKLHVFQGVSMADYNLVGMLARMIALGVILRPSEIYEHKPGDYNVTHYQKEATSKIMLFEMVEYKQVLYLDADGLILQNLDFVFDLNIPPVALLPVRDKDAPSLQYSTRVMLLQPSKSVHAQLQFVIEKDRGYDDIRILSEYFLDEVHSLPARLALQSYELRTTNQKRPSGHTASVLLQEASYVHFFDSPDFPKHWQWANPSRIPKMLPTCTETCDERASWLYVYQMLRTDRTDVCTSSH